MFSHVQDLFLYQRRQMKTDNCPLAHSIAKSTPLLPLLEDAFGYERLQIFIYGLFRWDLQNLAKDFFACSFIASY